MTDTTATIVAETVMTITKIVAISEAISEVALLSEVVASEVVVGVDGMIENDSPHETERETGILRKIDAVAHAVLLAVVDPAEDPDDATTGIVRRGDQSLRTYPICRPTHLLACLWLRSTVTRTNLEEISGHSHPQKTRHRRQRRLSHRYHRRRMEGLRDRLP